jgi:hypothetical protein
VTPFQEEMRLTIMVGGGAILFAGLVFLIAMIGEYRLLRRRVDAVESRILKPLPPLPRPSREQCPACKFAFIPGALRTPEQRQCACATFLGGGL